MQTRHEAEQEGGPGGLRALESRLALVLEASSMGTFVWHVAEDRADADPRMLELVGLAPGDRLTLASALGEPIHPEDRARFAEALRRALDPRGDLRLREEVRVRLPHGGCRWVAITGQVQLDETGTPRQLAGVALDVTERHEAEAALRDSEARHAFMLGLGDRLRTLDDADTIASEGARLIARHLGADRVLFAEMVGETLVVNDCAEGVASLSGRYGPTGPPEPVPLRAGGIEMTAAVAAAPRLSPEARASLTAASVAAFINAPVIEGDRWLATLAVHSRVPRSWSRAEFELAGEAAGRIHKAVERARGEAALRESEHRLRAALEAGRMGTWRFNLRTGEQQWSTGQFEIFGLEPGPAPPSRELFLSLVHPDDLALVEFSTADIRPQGTFLDSEFRIRRPDGEVRWVVAHALARFTEDGEPIELIGVNQDVTDRRRADEALRNSEERLREFGEASSDILWIMNAKTLQWEYLSPAFSRISGLSQADAMRGDHMRQWLELIVPEDRTAVLEELEKVRKGRRLNYDFRIRRPVDGEVRWLRNTVFPMRNEAGEVARVGGIAKDFTAIKAAEEHQRFLLAELQHRVRNTLAMVRSIARRTAASTASVDAYITHLEGRIDAFARVQAALTRNPSAGVDLETMIAEELRGFADHGEMVRCSGPPLRVRPRAAESFGLAVHELATNAVKYGALATPGGRLAIDWQLV
ncbi:MAG: PAS domain-containing protein, partial [Devosia sp.]